MGSGNLPMLQRLSLLTFCLLLLLPGCQTTREMYYNAWENFGGYAKRERLVDYVVAARDEQGEAKEQFTSALEQFKSIVNFQGGDLEALYNDLNDSYEASADQAEAVRDRIASVRNVGSALFQEWDAEVEEISDSDLRRRSRELYDQTQQSYNEMLARMDAAAASMDPVLTRFRDRVLFIKSNLNAQAIASLRGTEVELTEDIEALIAEMEASIREADEFIAQIQQG